MPSSEPNECTDSTKPASIAGISVSEDPVFRFAYAPNGQPIHVRAEDTEGNRWDQTFEAVNG